MATEIRQQPVALPFYYGWVHVFIAALAMVGTLPGRTQGLRFKVEDESLALARDDPARRLALRTAARLDSTARRDLRSGDGTRWRVRDRNLLQFLECGLRAKTSRQNPGRRPGPDRDRLRAWPTRARRNHQPHRLLRIHLLFIDYRCVGAVAVGVVCEGPRPPIAC